MRRPTASILQNQKAYRKAAERFVRRHLKAIPPHYVGFSDNEGYYLIVHCLIGGKVQNYSVPCCGASVLKAVCGEVRRDWNAKHFPSPTTQEARA